MPRPKYLSNRKVNTALLYKTLVSLSDVVRGEPSFEGEFLEKLYEESVYPQPDLSELREWLVSYGGRSISDKELLNLLAYVSLYTPVKFVSRDYTVAVLKQSCKLVPPQLSHYDTWCYQIKAHMVTRRAAQKFVSITGIRRSSLPSVPVLSPATSVKNIVDTENNPENKPETKRAPVKRTFSKLPSFMEAAQQKMGKIMTIITRGNSSCPIAPMENSPSTTDRIQRSNDEEHIKNVSPRQGCDPEEGLESRSSDDSDQLFPQETESDDMNGTDNADQVPESTLEAGTTIPDVQMHHEINEIIPTEA
mmetsp:Transcript_22334/g.32533  ORF Transcript_22334/g.32533 Transcript_22334/m.32533 type:complete len:306 (-) Transcript_22334:410-1327(-)|eukprot:CAMPEP_0185032312 /NCGR_PEP_ID=MMETSP1103-20130426/20285_1 /TAXON_ID=36769 /ORGANISM="Paraphysomonas bandaiensis, Strain Caron Lab Isolate" /LENGTH=305 /DNA_ID=CAMNT_0027568159 /DNA_START=72 /DNA_END=989 /DNA_ORIENTATION=-